MEAFAKVQCPFCGQSFDVAVDTTITSQRFTTDCEVCCRPFEVTAECESGKIVSVEAREA
jgi:transcription elongation factor Elf1